MERNWACLRLTISNSFVDWVCAEVVEWGSSGIQVHETDDDDDGDRPSEQVILDIHFPEKEATAAHKRLKSFLDRLGPQAFPYRLKDPEPVPKADWAVEWQYHFPPINIGESILILPPWEQPEDGEKRKIIYLQPGMAFGTGHHPTTSLILEKLGDLSGLESPGIVLDIGCGSAILAIGAARMGAHLVLAVDHDRESVVAARSNVKRNELENNILVAHAEFPRLPAKGPFTLILANIYYTFFEKYIEELGFLLAPGGRAIVSGLRDEEIDATEVLINRAGLIMRSHVIRGGWLMLEAFHS